MRPDARCLSLPNQKTSKKLLWALCSAVMAGVGLGQASAAPVAVEEGRESFQSGGRKIKVETYFPQEAGNGKASGGSSSARYPAVIVLYGSGGALLGKGEMVAFARGLAAQGMAAFLVHYFNRTGSIAVMDKGITKHSWTWNETVRHGVDYVAAHPRVQPEAIGLMGYSLGGYLAVSESSEDTRIRAVVEMSGGVFDRLRGRTQRAAPTLILHGRLDERVPVGRVLDVQREARRHGVEPEVKIYETETHRFTQEALADAGARTQKFMTTHLVRRGAGR